MITPEIFDDNMDVHLDALNTIAASQDPPEESFSALLAAVAATNDTLQAAAHSSKAQQFSGAGAGMFLYTRARGDKILEKLQEWIKKAFAVLVQIARNLMNHGKISVSVGIVGVVLSVDVTAEVSGLATTTNP